MTRTYVSPAAIRQNAAARGWIAEPSPTDLLSMRLYTTDRRVVGNVTLAPAPWADSDDAAGVLRACR